MRYAVTHKNESRDRILNVAAGHFRKRGVEQVRVADVMHAAGLTVGGFYKHFVSKEELLHHAVERALTQVSNHIGEITAHHTSADALAKVIAFYLSEEHMRHPDLGCALAAMGTELARLPHPVKREIDRALAAYADRLSYLMPGKDIERQRALFHVLFPSMAGCIMTARALTDKSKQRLVLEQSRVFFTAAFCGSAPFAREVQP